MLGWPGLRGGLTASLAAGGLFFFLFLLGGMGAGDVKLMAAVAAWAGTANVVNLVFRCCSWLDAWAILQKETSRKMLLEGSSLLRRMVKEIFNRNFGWALMDNRLCF